MKLVYLTLSTILGFFTAIFLLVTIFDFSKGALIAASILVALFASCIYKYKKAAKKANPEIDDEETAHRKEFLIYVSTHHQELQDYTKAINDILLQRYHFKVFYRPQFIHNPQYAFSHVDYLFLKQKLRPDQAAKIIWEEVVTEGNDFNPNLIQDRFIAGKLPKLSGFYKAVFGSHNPSAKRVIGTFSLFLLLGLIFYGLPIGYFKIGDVDNSFLPSAEWLKIGTAMTWLTSLSIIFVLIRNPKSNYRFRRKYKGATLYLMYSLMSLFIFLTFHVIFKIAVPKALNQIAGTESIAYLEVTKDPKEHRTTGKTASFTPYCVTFQTPDVFILKNEYCVPKADYDKIPGTQPVKMRFNIISSYMGKRVVGYSALFQY